MKFKPLCKLPALLALLAGIGVWAQLGPAASPGATLTAVRATELRADKLASAPVLQQLASGAAVRLLGVEGGWALVESTAPGTPAPTRLTGWVRASMLDPQPGSSAASSLPSGRESASSTALAAGVRGLAARGNRHALIIGIGRYADSTVPPLPGVRQDRESATQMAQTMQVPIGNIRYLHDEQATGDNIRAAIRELTERVQDGDRVFIHYSGHGTRYNDAAAGGCVEALLAHDGGQSGTITNREMASMLKTITNKTDKLFVMYDACYSGGLVQAASSVRTRGIGNANDDGALRPKFASITEECGRPVNIKTRNLLVEATASGGLPQDIIHVSAARDNEVSFDDEQKGGLATQFMRDCMLRDAKDLDNSGAISVEEIRQCAQEKINRRMQNDANFKPHNLVLQGNAAFVPAWFSQPSAAPMVSAPTAVAAAPAPAPSPAVVTGAQALRQLFEQRDAKRGVQVTLGKDRLKIGQDTLELSVQSDRAGHVYVALAGSDNKAVHLLFPNALDTDNRIVPGQRLALPRANWRARAAGPPGTDSLLVLVTDGPRDLSQLPKAEGSPFVVSLNDAQGRARLGALMTAAQTATGPSCTTPAERKDNALCSDAYGAAIVTVEELP